MRRKAISILLAAAMVISLAACGTSGGKTVKNSGGYPGTKDKDMVTINITAEPMELNSILLSDAISQTLLSHLMAGFTRLDENDKVVADLAESWDISEDNMVYTMHLKKDAKWSNGDAVTANDFYYAWVTEMKPETGSVLASNVYNNIKNGEAFYNGEVKEEDLGLKVVDDYTLTIEWSHPIAEESALFYLSQGYFLPVNQKAYEKIGAENYAKDVDKMVTNGAYKMTKWVHDDQIIMEKSDDYYDADAISIPKLKLVMIGDSNTALNAFTAGELDVSNIYSEQIAQVKEKSEKAVESYADGGTWYINFNNKDENLSNANLRKALAYAIDTQSLLDNVINDGSVAADGLVPGAIAGAGGESYAEARGSLFAFDKEKAVTYLDAALKELGKTKEELKLVFWGSDTTYNQNQAAYLQQQWKENLGLEVELKPMAVKALQEAQYGGECTFAVDGWGPGENDAITFLENYETGALSNTGQYSNAEYDKLIADSRQETDAEKRQEILIQAEKMLIDEMVVGPLYFTRTTYAISEKVSGIIRTPFQFFNIRNASIVTK